MNKVVIISDTHGRHWDITIPKCAIFIFAGDANIYSLERLQEFNGWLSTIDAKHRIIIAGNHDRYLQKIGYDSCRHHFTNAIYLQDDGITVEGLKIYGSPRTPLFMSWAFMYPRESLEANKIWEQIPENLDILITHGMPYQILDHSNYQNQNVGCEVLQREVFKKRPKYYFGGHLHESHGHLEKEGTKFYNVSILDGDYKLVNEPTILEI